MAVDKAAWVSAISLFVNSISTKVFSRDDSQAAKWF